MADPNLPRVTSTDSNSSAIGLSWGRKFFYAVVLVATVPLVYLFVARGMRFFRVPSNSMEPAIMVSDYLLTLREDAYRRGDVVVARDPMAEKGYIVKRIVAMGGDRIEIRGGAVFVNGSYMSEPYRLEGIDYTMSKFHVGEDEVFLLGDNSNWSVDSHNWAAGSLDSKQAIPGGVAKSLIVGRVHYIYLPFQRMRRVGSYPLRTVEEL